MASENETVEEAISAVRKMIHECPANKGGLGEFEYQIKANGAIYRIESAWHRERKPKRNCDRFATAEEAYNACPQFCDIAVKTMSDRELKIVEAAIKCLDWLFAPIVEGGAK